MDEVEKFPKKLLDAPCSMEMSRTEIGPPEPDDPKNRTLKEKLKDHYNKGVKKDKKRLDNALTPECLNMTAVPMFLFTFVATMKIGVLDVMPLIYAGTGWVIYHQLVVIFIGTQMFVNWLGIRYMTSSYVSYKRRLGKEDEIKDDRNLFQHQVSQHSSDTSSAVLMPLVSDTNETSEASNNNGKELKDQEMDREAGNDLSKEVDKANQEMHKRLTEESNGIKDLIQMKDDSTCSNSPSDKDLKSGTENSVKFPKPVYSSATKTVTYPYWSWTPCYQCVSTRPPRCHHCPICKTCILKRDHHCYFAGSCVGYRNHRFFFIFLVWSWIGSMWATIHGFPYIYQFLWDDMSYIDVVFFFAIVRWILGFGSFQAALSVTTLSLLIYFDFITTMFIYTHSVLMDMGVTSFEKVYLKKSLTIKDTRTRWGKMKAIFGKRPITMFFIPIHFFVEPEEDPVNWPYVKVHKN